MDLTTGKFLGLQHISSRRGTITALALDHRQNLRKANPRFEDGEELSRFKLDVSSGLARHATAVLLDPEFSAAQAVAARAIPHSVGLVVALESTGYTGDATARQAQILPGWSVEKAKRMGACAVKLLVYYHPGSHSASQVEAFVAQVAADCRRQDLLLMLEPLSYALKEGQKLSSEEKREVVIETASHLTLPGVDILKAEFPLDIHHADEPEWERTCGEISSASRVPWILLSAAADYDVFLRQVTAACRAGASGIAVGRAVWQEAVSLRGVERSLFLERTARRRVSRLASLCHALARPWTEFYESPAPLSWFESYSS